VNVSKLLVNSVMSHNN